MIKQISLNRRRIALILVCTWIGCYAFRSYIGIYREDVQPGGIAYALWTPAAFNLTDLPLVIIDRTFCHKTVLTISGQGDMPRLFSISSDGRSLVPVAK